MEEARKNQQIMMNFVEKYKGKSVLFRSLSDDEKYQFVMLKSFMYFKFLPLMERYERAAANADCHKRSGYEVFLEDPNEHLVVTE